ncbi:MAG TPA: hypothetical protein VFU21_02035 [Kofleriaceae bacterium]|nr:hypothetical protein [Kofleriaceae bacterium]
MRVSQRVLAILLLLVVASCGGGKKGDTTTPGGDEGAGGDGAGGGAGAGGAQALPEIPSKPAAQPAAVLATLSIGDPKGQLGELSAYVDAMQPGMGAMVGANFLPSLAGMVGAPGLDGYDLSKPLHILILDPKKGGGEVLLVMAVADQQKLAGSVGGDAMVQMHDGFAAIGKGPALVAASPYALSNLAKSQTPAHPTAVFHMNKIMDSYGNEVRQQLAGSMGASKTPAEQKAAEAMVKALSSVERIEGALQASAQTATLSFAVVPMANSTLAQWGTMQKPSDFSVAGRLPKADWLVVGAGNIELGPMASFWADIAAAQGNAAVGQVFASFGQEMAIAIWVKDKAVRIAGLAAIKAGADKALATFFTDYATRMAKDPKAMDSMEVTAKANAYKTGGASLHEITVKPGKNTDPASAKEFTATFGKGGIKSYFGMAGNWAVFALDKATAAKGLAAKVVSGAKAKTPKSSLGKIFNDAIADSKQRKESGVIAIDLAQAAKDPKQGKGAQVTLGLGWEGPVLRARMTIPPATGRFMMQQMGGGMAPMP